MKVRNGFVSNSSSSSFVIPIKALDEGQIELIKNHIAVSPNEDSGDAWSIYLNDNCLRGYTHMDNFDMRRFLERVVRVPEEYVLWGEDEEDPIIDRINRDIEIAETMKERKEKIVKINGVLYEDDNIIIIKKKKDED